MPSDPLVSIVTPSYNQAAYLEQTIRSVLAQDFCSLEYIIIDGASQDESVDIIRKYSDQITSWVSEPDSGQAEAINKGFAQARGEIVAWLNSDDLLLPGAVSQAVNILQKYPDMGMVYSNAITIDLDGKPLNKLVFGDWGLGELIRFRIICQPAVFIRRAVLMEVGYLDPSFHFMLDHHLWLRIANRSPVKHIDGLWAAARHHPAAKNVAQPKGFSQESLRMLEWLQSEPGLAEKFQKDSRHILGGAYRLIARYYLDGGMAGESLKYYLRALRFWPGYTMKHAHRMAFAVLSLLNISGPANHFRQNKSSSNREQLAAELRREYPELLQSKKELSIETWPGLSLDI